MQKEELFGAIESILYISGDPVSLGDIARVFDLNELEVTDLLNQMAEMMTLSRRGLRVSITNDTVQLVTNPDYEPYIIKLIAPPQERTMSDSMMETLSIIAYRQPATKADIEAVRGVRCEYSVSQLLKQGFIRELGRKDCVGKPMMFGTTDKFLRKFGLHSIDELPRLPSILDEASDDNQ